jgi:ATP-dependent Clp protease protease subunit
MNEINISGIVGVDVTAAIVKSALADMDQSSQLIVRIDSEGGEVFEGLSIYDALSKYSGRKHAIIEPRAFSIASYILCACDTAEISENGYVMLHNPYIGDVGGDASDMASQAALLGKLQESLTKAYGQTRTIAAKGFCRAIRCGPER